MAICVLSRTRCRRRSHRLWHLVLVRFGEEFADARVEFKTEGTKLTGTKMLADVPFLRVSSIAPRTLVTPFSPPIQLQPEEYALYQNYPNPFNPTTVISFSLPYTSRVTLSASDVLGREVRTLLSDVLLDAGKHEATFDAGSFASALYFYKIVAVEIPDAETGEVPRSFTSIKKMILTR